MSLGKKVDGICTKSWAVECVTHEEKQAGVMHETLPLGEEFSVCVGAAL